MIIFFAFLLVAFLTNISNYAAENFLAPGIIILLHDKSYDLLISIAIILIGLILGAFNDIKKKNKTGYILLKSVLITIVMLPIFYHSKPSYIFNILNTEKSEIIPVELLGKGSFRYRTHNRYSVKVKENSKDFAQKYNKEYINYQSGPHYTKPPAIDTHPKQLCIILMHGTYGMDFATPPYHCPP